MRYDRIISGSIPGGKLRANKLILDRGGVASSRSRPGW
jgi:hypothetical protein